MEADKILGVVVQEVRRRLEGDGTGHDWWHIERVRTMARRIAEAENANLFIVDLGALLHDVADWKFHDGNESRCVEETLGILKLAGANGEITARVSEIVPCVSFKGANVRVSVPSLEAAVVQDADRLDAIGAIGIARVFAWGGYKQRVLHDPRALPVLHDTKEEFLFGNSTSFNHFHERVLLLRDRLNTATARRIADSRHSFVEAYLEQFRAEWEGKR